MTKGFMDNIQFKQLFFNGQKVQRLYQDGVQMFESTIRIPFPTVASVLTYNGKNQKVIFNNYDTKFFTVTGVEGTNAGTYTAVFQLKEGYGQDVQNDNAMYASYSLKQTIARQKVSAKPSITSTALKYNGNTQSITSVIANYDKNKMTLSGTTSSKNAGSFTAYVTPGANYCQPDGTYSKISLVWKINKISLAKPYLSGPAKVFSFDNTNKTWKVVNYNSSYMTQSGSTTFVASSFPNTADKTETVKWTLKDTVNYCWSDGTTAPVTDSWTVRYVPVGNKNFSGSGTIKIPDHVYQIKVFAVGGGGGTQNPEIPRYRVMGCSGAGGGYTVTKIIDVTPGETLSVVIGAGGTGVTEGKAGGTGGTSGVYRNGTPLVEAKGGDNANRSNLHYRNDNAICLDGGNGGSGGGGTRSAPTRFGEYSDHDGGGGLAGFNGYNGGNSYFSYPNTQGDTKYVQDSNGGKGQGSSTKAWGNTGLPYAKGGPGKATIGHQASTCGADGQHGTTYPGGIKNYNTNSNSLSGPGSGSAADRNQTIDYYYNTPPDGPYSAGELKKNGDSGTVLIKQGY